MEDYVYVYDDPLENGYVKTKIKLRHLKSVGLGKDTRSVIGKAIVWYHEEKKCYKIQYVATLTFTIGITLLSPLIILIGGLASTKEVAGNILDMFRGAKSGAFRQDMCYYTDSYYNKLHAIHKKLNKGKL